MSLVFPKAERSVVRSLNCIAVVRNVNIFSVINTTNITNVRSYKRTTNHKIIQQANVQTKKNEKYATNLIDLDVH